MEYKFIRNDTDRIRAIHNGRPPMFVLFSFRDQWSKAQVRITESKNGFEGYWIKVKIDDPVIQQNFEDTVLKNSINWDQVAIDQHNKEKQHLLDSYPFVMQARKLSIDEYQELSKWICAKFGKEGQRWATHREIGILFKNEEDAILFALKWG